MTYLKAKTPTQALSYADRETIADVLNLDESGTYHYHPDLIASFYIDEDGDQVQVALVDGRNRPINRSFFRSVLEQKKDNIQKHIDKIIEAEQKQEAISLENQAFRDAIADMQEDSWLFQPDTDVIFGGDRHE